MSHLLAPIGLSAQDSAVYLQLLEGGLAQPEEIAVSVVLTAEAVRAVLRRLAEAGLCTPVAGLAGRFVAVPPDVALEPLVARRQHALDELRARSAELTSLARAAAARPGHLVEVVVGHHAVLARIAELELGAREEVCVVDSPPYLDSPVSNSNELLALARGVRYRAVYHGPALAEPGAAELLDGYLAAGESARSLPSARLKMLIADRRRALVPFSFSGSDAANRLLIGPSPMLDALMLAFESLWDKATVLGDVTLADRRAGGLQARDRRILRLMAVGMKDRAIARALGVGERTVVRRIQALMTELDAGTRFQAGAQALRRGWLDVPAPPTDWQDRTGRTHSTEP